MSLHGFNFTYLTDFKTREECQQYLGMFIDHKYQEVKPSSIQCLPVPIDQCTYDIRMEHAAKEKK